MTEHYFEDDRVSMHYYKFGHGDKDMLCFHGFGMHGRQFKVLQEDLGDRYTFYGFDLFFHKGTVLKDQSLEAVKRGISKQELSSLFRRFCEQAGIHDFSILAYSMGSHYATCLIEEMPELVKEMIIAAPSSFKPGKVLTFFSCNKIGNKVLERLALSNHGMTSLLSLMKRVGVLDQQAYEILYREIATPELRFAIYACTSYMHLLTLNPTKFVEQLNAYQIKCVLIFGQRDRSYPPSIGREIISRIEHCKSLVINEDHNMINVHLGQTLLKTLHDH